MLQDGKVPRIHSTSKWLVYLNYRDFGTTPSDKSHFCCVSTPYVFNAYYCIYGLTGSVGGAAEKKFLMENYKATSFRVPLFLETCTGVGKKKIVCHTPTLHLDRQSQRSMIVETALNMRAKVPVLVITHEEEGSPAFENFEGVYDALHRAVGGAQGEVQILAEIDPKNDMRSMKSQWHDIISSATERLDEQHVFPITVTNAWGGRGHDFRCLDDSIEEGDGMMLIMTTVPQEREWTQWKGRTARQDLSGQFKVVLSRGDAPFKDGFEHCDDGVEQGQSLVEKLLEFNDKANEKTISEMKGELDWGLRLAKLCDKYYQKFPRSSDDAWPSPRYPQQDRALRDVLGSSSTEKISEFERKFGLGQ